MGNCCCDPRGCDAFFGERFARRVAKRYRAKGLDRTAQRIVDFLADQGIDGATVLEIGGGVGEIGLELLRRGASSVTNLELSPGYEEHAAALVAENGFTGRVHRRLVDIAADPGDVAAADLVVLHRVVCCYPDYERLLGAAADHCRVRLAFSHPPRNLVSRAIIASQNAICGLSRRDFRAFVHPPAAMVGVVEAQGMRPAFRHAGRVWQAAGLTR